MVSAITRAEAAGAAASLARTASSSATATNSFAQQLATAVEGYLKQSNNGSPIDIKVSEVSGQNSGGSQFLVTVTQGSASPSTPSNDIPTMLGMGPIAGTAPVQQVSDPHPVAAAPVTEEDAYWAEQPLAVQALRDMPDGEAKDNLALSLANQGYSIDTQIMVWGWDPQMTMTVRENQGYSWVPSYGQSNIPIGPGLSMPGNPNPYNPGNPPVGAIQVSTAFAVGTIQNPLIQTDTSAS